MHNRLLVVMLHQGSCKIHVIEYKNDIQIQFLYQFMYTYLQHRSAPRFGFVLRKGIHNEQFIRNFKSARALVCGCVQNSVSCLHHRMCVRACILQRSIGRSERSKAGITNRRRCHTRFKTSGVCQFFPGIRSY